MAKNAEKIKAALEARIAAVPHGVSGYKIPGSMNKKKTGYAKIKNYNTKSS